MIKNSVSYSITPRWVKVKNADYYEIESDRIRLLSLRLLIRGSKDLFVINFNTKQNLTYDLKAIEFFLIDPKLRFKKLWTK